MEENEKKIYITIYTDGSVVLNEGVIWYPYPILNQLNNLAKDIEKIITATAISSVMEQKS